MRDRSNSGSPLTLKGQVYEKGLGAHANSQAEYWLGGAYQRLTATVGVDDACVGSVVFKVLCDGELRFESPIMTRGDEPLALEVALVGVNRLELLVGDSGDGIGCDHGNWANAKVE